MQHNSAIQIVYSIIISNVKYFNSSTITILIVGVDKLLETKVADIRCVYTVQDDLWGKRSADERNYLT